MLTADLVRARKKGKELVLLFIDNKERERAETLAAHILDCIQNHVGCSQKKIDKALGEIEIDASESKLKAGLVKLAFDMCEFEKVDDINKCIDLRSTLFSRASLQRQKGNFDRALLIRELAEEKGLEEHKLEEAIFADLKGASRLLSAPKIDPTKLCAKYNYELQKAILLKASKIRIRLFHESAILTRAFFSKLKFLRLLFRLEKKGQEYKLEIEGPMGLFSQTSRYGFEMAMLFPYLKMFGSYELEADIVWGEKRTILLYRNDEASPRLEVLPATSDEKSKCLSLEESLLHSRQVERHFSVQKLLEYQEKLAGGAERLRHLPFQFRPSSEILHNGGMDVVLADLECVDLNEKEGRKIYIEILGYYGRDAVFRRIEFAEKWRFSPIVFCLSEKLRVSAEMIPAHHSSSLFVFKNEIQPKMFCDFLLKNYFQP